METVKTRAKKINMELFEELWKKADADLPIIDGLDDLILEEIKTLRYGNEG